MPDYTNKLKIRLLEGSDRFVDDTFNIILKDMDDKLVGVSHLTSGAHFTVWGEATIYAVGDIVRTPHLKSGQFMECLVAGTSGLSMPTYNVDGTKFSDGSVEWIIRTWSTTSDNTVSIWLSGEDYVAGSLVLYNSSLYRAKVKHTATSFEEDKDKWQEIYASVRNWKGGMFYDVKDSVIYDNSLYICVNANSDTVFTPINWLLVNNFSLVSEWCVSTDYRKNQLIISEGLIYKANATHISSSSAFSDDISYWDAISANIRIWQSGVTYSVNDVVFCGNTCYICKNGHIAGSDIRQNYDDWDLLIRNNAYIKNWKENYFYDSGQVVVYDDVIFRCILANSDVTFEPSHWEVIGGAGGMSVWQDNKSYNEGQLVSYNNILYKANSKHTSSASFSVDIANWDIVNAGLNSWSTSVYYPAGMIVIANNKIYQCTTAHTSTTFTADEANWQEISGYRIVIDDWKDTTDYVVGDLCAHDKKIYRCTVKHTSGAKFDSIEEANWEELSPTINEITDWKSSTSYNAKDIVINDNALYRCKTAHTSTSDFATDALTYWVKLSGANAVSVWASSKSYDEGQLVVYNNQLFRANANHASSATFDLDWAKWNMLESNIGEYKANVYYPIGTAVIYNNALFKCKVAYNSTSTFNRDNWTRIDNNNPLVKDWTASTYYYANDIVLHGNQLYRCNANHTSSNFSADKANWTKVLSSGFAFKANTYYEKGSIVEYNGDFYKCRYAGSYADFNQLSWEKISRTVETWKPCYFSDSLISLVTFTPGTYNQYVTSNGATLDGTLAFSDSNSAVSFYFYEGGSPSSNLYYYDTGGYNNNYVHLTRASGMLTTSSLGVYKDAKDFTMDFFVNNSSYIVTMFGGNVSVSSSVTADWHYVYIQYNASGNTADAWMDGIYVGNFALGNDTAITLTGANASFDNIRFTSGVNYSASESVPIPPPSVYDMGNDYRYYSYNVGDFAEYEGTLYRCITKDSDSIFVPKKWQQVANIVLTWNQNSYYFAGQLVMDGQTLLRCTEAHTSGADIDDSKWEVVADNKVVIKDWESSKKYFKDNVVFKDNVLYRCTAEHTSKAFDTELNDGYWIKVSGGSSGGGSGTSNYSQFAVMNVAAPKTYKIKIEETTDFCFPPVEVLKFKPGDEDIVVDALTFDLSDGKMFEVEGVLSDGSPFALYKDGKLYLNTEYAYKHGTTTSCGNGYTTISEDIDLSVFKNVDSVEVINN